MSIIFRVAFNNQGWSGKCKGALKDDRLFKCRQQVVNIGYGSFHINNDGTCNSECWESFLCSSFSWVNHKGNYDAGRAYGRAYFVYPARDNSLTYWGESQVKSVVESKIYFEPFAPLPYEVHVRGLRAINFLGVVWGNGTHRYLDDQQERRLIQLLASRRPPPSVSYP